MSDNYGYVFTIKPAHHFGTTSSAYLINTENGGGSSVTLWRIDNPISNPSIHQQAIINVASYSVPVGAVQEGSSVTLDVGDCRTQDCVWRNGYLYTAFTTKHDWGSGNVDAIQYLKINTGTNTAAIDAVYGDASSYYIYPNIYVDNSGDVVMVFSRSGSSEYGSVRWTFRTPGDASARSSQSLKEGEGTYVHYDQNGANRWGDYSGIALDPGYDNKFWFCGEWATTNSSNWSTQIGSYHIYPDTLSGTIASNRTLDGSYAVPANVSVSSNATLTIDAGTILGFAPGKEIVVEPGSKITANGTSGSPIRFQRLDPSQAWGQVYLYGSGNQFTWCLFDGGTKNVGVGSKDNYFTDCTFRNGWRGISSSANNDGSGGRSYFKLSYCMVEDNSTVGVVAYHADAGFYHSTIQHSGSAGLWLYDSPARYFYNTAILNNDYDPNYSNRDGVEVVGGSDVDLLVYNNNVGYFPGFNRVAYNPVDQILVDASSSLVMGNAGTGDEGDNGIFGGGYRINNESSTTVDAYGNWWGITDPPSSFFSGPVDYSGSLTYDPSTSAGVGSNNYPHQVVPSNPEPMLVRGGTQEPPSEMKTMATTKYGGFPTPATNERERRRQRMKSLLGQLAQPASAQSLMAGMKELYKLHMMSRGDTTFADQLSQDRSLWDGLIGHYLSGDQSQNPGGVRLSASQAERLMLMDEHEAYRFGRYEETQKKVTKYAPYITTTRGKIMNMADRMNLFHWKKDYQRELTLLDKVEQAEVSLGEPAKQVAARYQIARENMQQALEQQMAGSGSGGIAGNKADSAASVKPDHTNLQANYPNPFNPTTLISYRLVRGSHVRLTVWDVLGRRVATLVDANQQSGPHQVTFNASGLSSGVYFYRLQAGNKVLVKKMLVMK